MSAVRSTGSHGDVGSGTIVDNLEPPRVSRGHIAILMLGTCGAFMAYITILAYSLAVRVDQLAPGHTEYLGYLTGLGGVVSLCAGPVVGVLSDRVRSRFGRRRPVLVSGALLGSVALVILGLAPNLGVLALGWVLAVVGWSAAMSSIGALQADTLPSSQRGTVAGLNGFSQQGAPVLGVVLAGLLSEHSLLLMLGPGLLGILLLIPLLLSAHETDSRAAVFDEPLNLRTIVRKYRYNPRSHPDFSWEWLGRFLFSSGIAFTTSFTTFFFAQRLSISVEEVAHAVAAISGLGVVAATIGSIGGGWLSDRLRRRRLFILIATMLFASGAVVYASAQTFPALIVAACLTSAGLGAFTATDQALVFDILPDRREAGRYMAISTIAFTLPRTTAPVVAPLLLATGAGGEDNFTVLYLVGGTLAVLGGLVIFLRVKGSR